MFAITWQYLTGSYRASDLIDVSRPEWPPHPDRVFQALVASWGARGCSENERDALRWLETLEPPAICVPDHPSPTPVPAVYVPPNDIQPPDNAWAAGIYVDSYIGILPDKRKRKLRHNAALWVGNDLCALSWTTISHEDFAKHEPALGALASGVTRIGRSSSFVVCRVRRRAYSPAYVPDASGRAGRVMIRVAGPGRLRELEEAYQEGSRPPPAIEIPYRHGNTGTRKSNDTDSPSRTFSRDLLIFRIAGTDTVPLTDTLTLTAALRRALITEASKHASGLLPLVSGHAPNGAPLDSPHCAYMPLPFVGGAHGNGRVLGLAIVLPENLRDDQEIALIRLIGHRLDDVGNLDLHDSILGRIRLATAIGSAPPRTLQTATWTGSGTRWASVTPVVMDRMQNRRRSEPDAWAADEVTRMLTQAGFPEPQSIRILPVSCHRGAPAVFDSPPIVRKDCRVRRMVHVDIRFSAPVTGPLLIGSGRYRGYGLCKPFFTQETAT